MTALEHPARADGPVRPPVRIPFPVVDEVARHCLQEEEPETVHIEVHLPGRLDRDRLRASFAEALRRHPRILMREAPGHWYRRRYEWELTPEPDVEVVTFPPGGRGALRDARTRALTTAPPLTLSPPIRLEVVEGPGPVEGSEATDAVGEPPATTRRQREATTPRPPDAAAGKGTVLFLTINHTALDGPACLRVLATAAELYGGQD
ncbi:condensation protein, partial [Streptomyces griseorubiginosus]|nr:condensation protein [Streptomyces griseorubiginosus]